MIETLDSITKYWPVFTFAVSGIFMLGMLYFKVQLNLRTTAKLFNVMDMFREFKVGQLKDNETFREHHNEMMIKFEKHHDLDTERFTQMNVRFDELMKFITAHMMGK